MSAILALVTAVVLILVASLRARKPRVHEDEVIVKRYIHPGHAWARVDEDGYVIVGMDEFAQSLIGTVNEIKLPRLLRHVHQGAIAWKVQHGQRIVPMVSPVSGWVVEKNEAVLRNPSLVNNAPYGDGWLFKVRPHRLTAELHNLLTGRAAQHWQDLVRTQLAKFFSGTPALMYQDGGVLVKNLADRCSDEEWSAITSEFFLADESSKETRQ